MAQHIGLYVNDYTLALDERAVAALLEWAGKYDEDAQPASALPIFI